MFRRLGDPTNVFTRLDKPLFLRNALSGPPLPVLSSLWRKRGEVAEDSICGGGVSMLLGRLVMKLVVWRNWGFLIVEAALCD